MNKSDVVAIIRSLLSSTNSTYSIYNLNKDFKNETGIDIPLFGYNNICNFLNSIPDTVKVTGVYPAHKISLVVSDKSAHIVSLVKRQKKKEPRRKPLSKWKSLSTELRFGAEELPIESKMIFQKGAASYSRVQPDLPITTRTSLWVEEKIPALDIRVHIQIGEYVEVCPCWILSPDKFYFSLRKFKKKFDDFTRNLQIFYSTHEEIPNVTYDKVQFRQPCAVFHKISSEAKWHRGEIQEVNWKTSEVVVNFIDYGKSAKISRENVKYLHRNFESFPRQAILGSLANIKPPIGIRQWPVESVKAFYDLAFDKELIGGVVHIDNKDDCVRMTLSYTGDCEIHINDTLVKEGYAEFDIKENLESQVFFLASDNWNNKRLRKMFSSVEKK